jgi:hypothetical protein
VSFFVTTNRKEKKREENKLKEKNRETVFTVRLTEKKKRLADWLAGCLAG